MSERPVRFDNLRVCVVGPFLPRPGGVSVQTELLCRFLAKERAVVHRVDTNVENIRQIPRLGHWLLPFAQVLAVFWRLLRATPRSDVIHVQAASYWAFYLPVGLSLLFGRLLRRRVVVSFFGGMAAEFMARHQRWAWPMLRRLDGFAVSSQFLHEVFQRYGVEALVIPSVIEIERFPFRQRTEWPPLVLWMRSLMTHANPAMALRAFALLRQALPEARLMMIGRGPLAKEVGALAHELGVADAIAYRPWLPFAQLRQAMQAASVLWNTCSYDNFPLSVLEAAASGAVIVSTAVGGVPELLTDGVDGLLVESDDHAALAAATAQVLRRPMLADGLARNARLVVERYSWGGIREDVAALYGLVPVDPLARRRWHAYDDSGDWEPPPPGAGRVEWELMGLRGRSEFLQGQPEPSQPETPAPQQAPTGRRTRRR
jgi:glycosyltransferase involved in cell wall biosynthesis